MVVDVPLVTTTFFTNTNKMFFFNVCVSSTKQFGKHSAFICSCLRLFVIEMTSTHVVIDTLCRPVRKM